MKTLLLLLLSNVNITGCDSNATVIMEPGKKVRKEVHIKLFTGKINHFNLIIFLDKLQNGNTDLISL